MVTGDRVRLAGFSAFLYSDTRGTYDDLWPPVTVSSVTLFQEMLCARARSHRSQIPPGKHVLDVTDHTFQGFIFPGRSR